jgi:hypothetical protein
VNCYITGQQPAGDPNNGANDVDGGKTTLLTPIYNLSAYENPVIEYYRWYTDRTNIDDTFYVDISGDSGATWSNLEMVTSTENYWKKRRWLASQFTDQFSQIRLRFVAKDRGLGSIVEGGVDDLTLYSFATVGIHNDEIGSVPVSFGLRPNYPNPFNGRTEISFDLPIASDVNLRIFDIAGRMVRTQNMADLAAGNHSIVWDGRTDFGIEAATGVYFYRIQAGVYTQTRKMLLLK